MELQSSREHEGKRDNRGKCWVLQKFEMKEKPLHSNKYIRFSFSLFIRSSLNELLLLPAIAFIDSFIHVFLFRYFPSSALFAYAVCSCNVIAYIGNSVDWFWNLIKNGFSFYRFLCLLYCYIMRREKSIYYIKLRAKCEVNEIGWISVTADFLFWFGGAKGRQHSERVQL